MNGINYPEAEPRVTPPLRERKSLISRQSSPMLASGYSGGQITLHNQWVVKAPINDVFRIMTDFEKFPEHFPKVAESIQINKRVGNYVEMEATVRSFGKRFGVLMKTQILPGKGFISDNDSYQFGTSGHEEMKLAQHPKGTLIDYTYHVTIHKKWLGIIAVPLIRWYSMKYWEKAVIDQLKKILEK